MAAALDTEPYFVDFLRDAPEPTGTASVIAINDTLRAISALIFFL